jgi:hypothetical protein
MKKVILLFLILFYANCNYTEIFTQRNTYSGQKIDSRKIKTVKELTPENKDNPIVLTNESKNDIIKTYGKPAMTFEKGKILVFRFYEENNILINPGRRYVMTDQPYGSAGAIKYHLVVVFDKDNKISRWNLVKLR